MSQRFSDFKAGFRLFWEMIRTTFMSLDWEFVGFIAAMFWLFLVAVPFGIAFAWALSLFR